jgi:hypothetical protein
MIRTQPDPRFHIGMTESWKGQRYELIEFRPHIRRDRRPTVLLIWRSQCPSCGEDFVTATPQRKFKEPTRRCWLHAHPGKRVR